jgi:aminomethyltransferase
MVDFAGWSMPVQYQSIIQEHLATRNAIGLFDVSHMGRFEFRGPAADRLIDGLVTRRVTDMSVGQIRYALVTNSEGGILDDVLVYRLQKADQPVYFGMVVNASNREKIAHWVQQHIGNYDVEFTDKTLETTMIAVQGPKALSLLQPMTERKLSEIKNYHGAFASVSGYPALVSRTGYTGEDGCELIVAAEHGLALWQQLIEAARPLGGLPAGLGARDTLRLEAAMPLYGHELSETINPVQAGLNFAINLKDREFVGCRAISRSKNDPLQPVRVGLELSGRRAAREHCQVIVDSQVVGEVTSGTFSPTLQKPIAMAYVNRSIATPGQEVEVDIRGKKQAATIVKLPFYQRKNET